MFYSSNFKSTMGTKRTCKSMQISKNDLLLTKEMKVYIKNQLFVVLLSLLLAGCEIEASPYNYSTSIKCLDEPPAPQYEGGLVINPEFEDGLKGWNEFSHGTIEVRKSIMGNPFIVSFHRIQPYDSISQRLFLRKGIFYTFSAWVQINEGKEAVVALFKNSRSLIMVAGSVVAQAGCWSMLKGGLTVDFDMRADLYFQSNNTNIELWVDSVSLKPFTKSQWRDHQSESIKKTRQRNLRLHVTDEEGRKLQGVEITIKQTKTRFTIGCAIAETILKNKAYQKWFTARFSNTATTFNNEMKWYYTEKSRGHENYSVPDAMVAFARQHGIGVRGHTIAWDNPVMNLKWVRSLSTKDLLSATIHRTGSVMARYTGDVIGWDVMNENLHFTYFEDRLGPDASSMLFKVAQALDPNTTMFLNEYNTLEMPEDAKSTPSMFLQKIAKIRSYPGNEQMVVGIGLQGHFHEVNIPYIRASLDTLGATKMPIWITELDVSKSPTQVNDLEDVMREFYSHPAVEGIIVWAGWKPRGCSEMCLTHTNFKNMPHGCHHLCLTDNDFKNLPTGDVVDKLMKEWNTKTLKGVTNEDGIYEHQVFHGEYLVTVFNPESGTTFSRNLTVSGKKNHKTTEFWIFV